MKVTHKFKGNPATVIRVKFTIVSAHLETAIIAIWLKGLGAAKRRIKEEIEDMFYSGGSDGWSDWNNQDDAEDYIEKAKTHAQKLFPTFYKKDQS